jgi:NADH-quinone oxidoreductase subunit J
MNIANIFFYVSGAVAVTSTFMVITRRNGVHALLYLIVSFLALAFVLSLLGAPFVAALEVIIYAGAIMVLFVFVMMMLNVGPDSHQQMKSWMNVKVWTGPSILAGVLLIELLLIVSGVGPRALIPRVIGPREVSVAMFGTYVLGIELSSMLLLAGMVGAYHLGRRNDEPPQDRRDA